MSQWPLHVVAGIAGSLAPDVALVFLPTRRLPLSHPLLRVHRLLHHPATVFLLAYALHLALDFLTHDHHWRRWLLTGVESDPPISKAS